MHQLQKYTLHETMRHGPFLPPRLQAVRRGRASRGRRRWLWLSGELGLAEDDGLDQDPLPAIDVILGSALDGEGPGRLAGANLDQGLFHGLGSSRRRLEPVVDGPRDQPRHAVVCAFHEPRPLGRLRRLGRGRQEAEETVAGRGEAVPHDMLQTACAHG